MSANAGPREWDVSDRNSQGDPDHVRDSDGNEGRVDYGMSVVGTVRDDDGNDKGSLDPRDY